MSAILTGCGAKDGVGSRLQGAESGELSEEGLNAAPGSSPLVVSSRDTTPLDHAPFSGTTGWRGAGPLVRGVATLTDVRTAEHPTGFVRTTFEFAGGLPGYAIEYADAPVAQCGSGEPADVAGAAHLVVRLHPARAHRFVGERAISTIRERDRRLGGGALQQLTVTCDFEGEVAWVLGLDERREYRVTALQRPARLAVDVEYAGAGEGVGADSGGRLP